MSTQTHTRVVRYGRVTLEGREYTSPAWLRQEGCRVTIEMGADGPVDPSIRPVAWVQW